MRRLFWATLWVTPELVLVAVRAQLHQYESAQTRLNPGSTVSVADPCARRSSHK